MVTSTRETERPAGANAVPVTFQPAPARKAPVVGEVIVTPGALRTVTPVLVAVAVFVAASVARAVIAYDGEPACLTGSYVHA
jgi:hypothetical protein